MGKKKMSAADEAWLRNQAQLEGVVPTSGETLPGQIDMLDGSIAGTTEHVEGMGLAMAHLILDNLPEPPKGSGIVAWPHIPEKCPQCHRTMLIESGWAVMKPREERRLQCGNCAVIITVPQGAYDTLALAIQRRFESIDRMRPKLAKEKKSRGAG